MNTDRLYIKPELTIIGPNPAGPELQSLRKLLLAKIQTSSDVRQSESSWLKEAIAKLLGKESVDLSGSLEQLGIDSLGRLQLWHAFRRQFPNSRMAQLSANQPLSVVLGEERTSREEKPKWLAIHGFRTNPSVIEHQLGEFVPAFIGDVELVCPQAPHPARGPCPHGGEGFEWWSAIEDSSYEGGWIGDIGLDDSMKLVEEICRKTEFDGVIAFSQGAGLAHALLVEGLVKKGILFSPVAPKGRVWPPKTVGSFRAVVIRDMADGSVDGYPTCDLTVITHNAGHSIPAVHLIDRLGLVEVMLDK